jgi:hypothetical protein
MTKKKKITISIISLLLVAPILVLGVYYGGSCWYVKPVECRDSENNYLVNLHCRDSSVQYISICKEGQECGLDYRENYESFSGDLDFNNLYCKINPEQLPINFVNDYENIVDYIQRK